MDVDADTIKQLETGDPEIDMDTLARSFLALGEIDCFFNLVDALSNGFILSEDEVEFPENMEP